MRQGKGLTMKSMKRVMWLVVAAVIGFACFAQADAMEDAKARRRARREQVEQLVSAGKAEEGADGYLAAKAGADAAAGEVVKAENADRKIGYEAIAKANGQSVAEVGKQAAVAIQRMRATKK